jgi:hypothetical protein
MTPRTGEHERIERSEYPDERTFNADERAVLGEAVNEIFGGWWRLPLPAIQATSDVSFLLCGWTKLGQVLTADGTSRICERALPIGCTKTPLLCEVAQLRASLPRQIGDR